MPASFRLDRRLHGRRSVRLLQFDPAIDGIPFVVAVALSGVCAALVGIVFGLPSLRIRGLYLAVATLASQFFIVWALDKFGWFKNYDPAGVITAQPIVMFGHNFATPREKYWVVLAIVAVLALLAKNMARGSVGRGWMAVRDMDVAAEVMGFSLLRTKLQAFAISSFYCGVGGRCSRSPICRPWSRRPSASICRSEFSSWSSSAASAPSWARSWARASSC
jgi:ABC-type branched-subunit amino acid transport system permease subunit